MLQSNEEFFRQLERNPLLLERMKRLFRIVEGDNEIQNSHMVERAVTNELSPLGKELLQHWNKKQVLQSQYKVRVI